MSRIRSRLTPLAQSLRKADNTPESRLWNVLRGRQFDGHKFRRQLPIGNYIADFACVKRCLIIELDGSQHIDSYNDRVRDDWLVSAGWSVARFPSGHMVSAPDAVLETIAAICEGRIGEDIISHDFQFRLAKPVTRAATPHPGPLPSSGERGKEGDLAFMDQAIALGLNQLGRTWPNPPVGCVLVKDGAVIATGATGDGGRPHAEEVALAQAGAAAEGATAYVTLEPCGQRSTGAASCGQRLVDAKVARVVYACADPSPYASHKGPERLKAAGIAVESGLCADAAQRLIAGFVHFLATGRPLVATITPDSRVDAEFTADPAADLDAELRAWGQRGYRTLGVAEGSALAEALQKAGLLSQ
jgi:pyrimidine deaminase RibD-like protein/very-short-patch-repair endonuclease